MDERKVKLMVQERDQLRVEVTQLRETNKRLERLTGELRQQIQGLLAGRRGSSAVPSPFALPRPEEMPQQPVRRGRGSVKKEPPPLIEYDITWQVDNADNAKGTGS